MIPNLTLGALIALFGGALAFSVGAIVATIRNALIGEGE